MYWQWRIDLPHIGPRLFRIDSGKGKDAVKHVPNFAASEITSAGVYVIDGVFELFVVVGAQARGKRTDIRLALYIAEVRTLSLARCLWLTRSRISLWPWRGIGHSTL